MDKIEKYLNHYTEVAALYAPKLALALLVFALGLWATNIITRVVANVMLKRKLDESLQSFLSSLLSVSLKILLLVTVAGVLGLQTTSFVAVIGAAGLAVGLALQGSLSNFAGGVLILVFKPFKVGDLIEVTGLFGEVKEIQIFNTVLLTPDKKTVILANAVVSNGTIVNYSRHGNLLVDIPIAVDLANEIEKVRTVFIEAIKKNPKVLSAPPITVDIMKIFDGAAHLTVRSHCLPQDYWDVYFQNQSILKATIEKNEIALPITTRMVLLKNQQPN